MAERGYRLKKCGKMTYTFDACNPGDMSTPLSLLVTNPIPRQRIIARYLEEMGFRTLTKNINLNFFLWQGKDGDICKGMGQITTSPGSYNKELLIAEKKKGRKTF
jgi:hypothetical protein